MRKKYIGFLVIIVAILIAVGVIYSKPQSETAYLKKNAKELKLDKPEDYLDLKVISNSIKDKEIIFTGEGHGVKQNTDIQFKFLNYLIDNWDLRYYVTEMGHSEAMMLNEYLATGNEESLKEIFQDWYSFTATDEKYNMYKKLYEKNKSLPEDKKITILGIDSGSMSEIHIKKYMQVIINKIEKLPMELNVFKDNMDLLDSIGVHTISPYLSKEKSENNRKEVLRIVGDIEKHMKDNKELYERTFKEDLFNIEFILSNIKDLQNMPRQSLDVGVSKDLELLNIRDKYIYENFKKIYEHYPKGKYYFHYGREHTRLNEFKGYNTIATHLQKDENFKGKLYSIRTYYGDGRITNMNNESIYLSSEIPQGLDKQLKACFGDNYGDLIINLENEKSSITDTLISNYFDSEGQEDLDSSKGTKTTDYFQGVIIVKKPNGHTFYMKRDK